MAQHLRSLAEMDIRVSAVVLSSLLAFSAACSSNSASPSPDAGGDGGEPGAPDGTVADATDDAGDAAGPGRAEAGTDASGEPGDDAGKGIDGTFGAACTASSTCDGGDCLFAIDGGCDAGGRCFYHVVPPGQTECQHATGMCACDGTGTYQLDCEAPGYAEAPVPSPTAFTCAADAGTDGSPDAQ